MKTRTLEQLQALRERVQHFKAQQDPSARAYHGDRLEADANAVLGNDGAGLTPDEIAFVRAVVKIAQGDDVQLPDFLGDVRPTHLAESGRNAPMPDRIVGLISHTERVELAEVAKSVPEHGRDRLVSMLKLEQASDSGMKLLTDPERAAARLHADREHERSHLARLSEEAKASGDRLDAIATSTASGPGAPMLRNF